MSQKGYLIDLDGTMYRGTQPIEGARQWVESLLSKGIPFLFLTNNSARSCAQMKENMEKMGFKGIEVKHFYSSAMASAAYVAKNYTSRRVFMIGEEGLKEALNKQGFEIISKDADFVFVGLNRMGNYELYSEAIRELLKGAILVGTNNDRILLSENGANIGNGSIVSMMEYASNQVALKIGKPHPVILQEALLHMQVSKDEMILVGDNMETDILLGFNEGMETIFVSTGVHSFEQSQAYNFKATHSISNLEQLIR